MKKRVVGLLVTALLGASGCLVDQTMWGACDPNGDPFGTDKTWVFHCRSGEWTPIMTVNEYISIRQGKPTVIGEVPAKPAVPTAQISMLIGGGIPTTGGTVRITGSNLSTSTVEVRVNGVAVSTAGYRGENGDLVVAVPGGPAGSTALVSTHSNGVATGHEVTITYVAPPVITAIESNAAPGATPGTWAGRTITIKGTFPNLDGMPSVNFTSTPAAVKVVPGGLEVVVPNAPAGMYWLNVSTWGGSAAFGNGQFIIWQ